MSEWVAVSERMPDREGWYLLWDGERMCVNPFRNRKKWQLPPCFWYGSDYFSEDCATHWRELPEPPKGDK